MTSAERLPMTAFPDRLHDEAIERIARYSVGITGIDLRESGEVPRQSGSGTLVDIEGTLCIVTADHVIEDIRHRDRIGLLIDWHGSLRRCVFDRNVLQFVRLPRGPTPDAGPDLGAILLPHVGEGLATLKANKVFYNLSKRVQQYAAGYQPLSDGVWFPCGVLGEDSRVLPPVRGFAHVTSHWGMVGIAPRPAESWRDGYDYLDFRGRPGIDHDMPDSFGGSSGGGVWQGLIAKHPDGRLELCELILSGVIFYQSAIDENGYRTLRSHGRASLNERLIDEIRLRKADGAI